MIIDNFWTEDLAIESFSGTEEPIPIEHKSEFEEFMNDEFFMNNEE